MTVKIQEAKKSEVFTAIASIAGAKAHKVWAQTLEEGAEAEVFVRKGYDAQRRWGNIYETRVIPAGTTLYIRPVCGTTRAVGDGWNSYENQYIPAETVTCAKCAASNYVSAR